MKIRLLNNTNAIKELLESIFINVGDVEHIGDFKFKTNISGRNIIIHTIPVEEDSIDLIDIRFEDAE